MATIEKTFKEIPLIRAEVRGLLDQSEILDAQFLRNVINWLEVYNIDLLAHACMSHLSQNVQIESLPSAYSEYIRITKDPLLYQEVIRISNVAGMVYLWFEFEQFIERQHNNIPKRKYSNRFPDQHRAVMDFLQFPADTLKHEFDILDGIRRTRNSLHRGGRYDKQEVQFELLDGNKYSLVRGKKVKPIRLLVILREMIRHYKQLENAGLVKRNLLNSR